MVLTTIYVCILLMTLTFWQVEACTSGFFGDDCQFRCHCKKGQCNSTGGCTPDICHEGFFGPGCQYLDEVFNRGSLGNPVYLQDDDETTCNPQKDQKSVEISLTSPITFYWMRVYVSHASIFSKGAPFFNLTIDQNGTCENRTVYLGHDYMDVLCTAIKMSKMTMRAAFVSKLCSVYLSGGRNVAIKQKTSQSSTYHTNEVKAGSDNAVDGSTQNHFDYGESCSRTEPEAEGPTWSVAFNFSEIIYSVFIFSEAEDFDQPLAIRLLALSNAGIVVHTYEQQIPQDNIFIIVEFFPQVPISSIAIQQTVNSSSRVLTLCEVQVFAEPVCPDGFFGLLCQSACGCKSANSCHSATGLCVTHKLVVEDDVIEVENVTECPNGTFGPTCTQICPAVCLEHNCDRITGKCDRCQPNHRRGACKVCIESKYGPACSQACPQGCLDNACDPETGNCFKCLDGFKGPKCDKTTSNVLIMLIVGTIACCIGVFLTVTYFLRRERLRGGDNESESSQREKSSVGSRLSVP